MKRSTLLLLVSPVVLVTVAYLVIPGRARGDLTLGHAFPEKVRVLYDLDWSSSADVSMPGSGASAGRDQAALQNMSVALQLQGTLAIRRVAGHSGVPMFCASLPVVTKHKAMVLGKNALATDQAVRTTFSGHEGCFELDKQGRIENFYFPGNAPVLFKQFVQGIFETLQYTTSAEGGDEWQGEEVNTLGTAITEYRLPTRAKDTIAWTRSKYRELKGLPPWARASAPIVKGQGDIAFDAQPSFKKLAGEERVRVESSSGGDLYNAHKQISATRLRVEQDTGRVSLAGLQPHAAGVLIGLDVAADAAEATLAAKTNLTAIQSLIQTHGGGEVSAEQFTGAVFLLRRDPKACETIGKLLQTALDPKQRTLAVDMLVFAGSADAQRVLREAVASNALVSDTQFRFRVLQRFALVAKPTMDSIAFLRSEIEAARRDGSDKLHHAALVSLGAVLGRSKEAGAVVQNADQMLKIMHDELKLASSSAEKSAALVALGNSRDPKQVGVLRGFENDGDSEVRHSVAMALGTIDSPESTAGLLNLATDSDLEVARAALKPFRARDLAAEQRVELERLIVAGTINRSADEDLTAVIARQADADPNATRRMLEALLSRHGDEEALTQSVRRMLQALEEGGT